MLEDPQQTVGRFLGQPPGPASVAHVRCRCNRIPTFGSLAPLPKPQALPAITQDTLLVQTPHAFCYLTANPEKLDISYPGGHIYIHRGDTGERRVYGQHAQIQGARDPGGFRG